MHIGNITYLQLLMVIDNLNKKSEDLQLIKFKTILLRSENIVKNLRDAEECYPITISVYVIVLITRVSAK